MTRHRDENTNLLLVGFILLRLHADRDRLCISACAPFVCGAQCKQAHALRSNQPEAFEQNRENYARLGVRHALSMTIATAHYRRKELFYNSLADGYYCVTNHGYEKSFDQNLVILWRGSQFCICTH